VPHRMAILPRSDRCDDGYLGKQFIQADNMLGPILVYATSLRCSVLTPEPRADSRMGQNKYRSDEPSAPCQDSVWLGDGRHFAECFASLSFLITWSAVIE
jgi:hypothetical protein